MGQQHAIIPVQVHRENRSTLGTDVITSRSSSLDASSDRMAYSAF